MPVSIKTPTEIEKMRTAGKLAAEVLEHIEHSVVDGVTTADLDKICHEYIVDVQKAIPAPLNYHGFPKSICTSVNHVVCHGIPSDKRLKTGDIINIDITVIKDGYHGDTSKMFGVGEISSKAHRLIDTCYACLKEGIALVEPGQRLGTIGHRIQKSSRGKKVFRCPRILRPRYRFSVPRRAPGSSLRKREYWLGAPDRHDFHHRAYDKFREKTRQVTL